MKLPQIPPSMKQVPLFLLAAVTSHDIQTSRSIYHNVARNFELPKTRVHIGRKMAGTAKGSVEGVEEVQLDGLVRKGVEGTDGVCFRSVHNSNH